MKITIIDGSKTIVKIPNQGILLFKIPLEFGPCGNWSIRGDGRTQVSVVPKNSFIIYSYVGYETGMSANLNYKKSNLSLSSWP